LKNIARGIAISVLYLKYAVAGRIGRLLKKNRVQFIYFHHVFDHEEAGFEKIILNLSRDHFFISHSEAVERIRSGNIDKPYLSVSFDDGFKNCIKAAEIMDRNGIKACFFVSPAFTGKKDHEEITDICKEKFHRPPVEFLDWDDIKRLLSAGHEIGSHGMTHSDLSGMNGKMLKAEIADTFGILNERTGDVKHFSWPFGRFENFSDAAARMVFDSGFISCSSAQRGCHISGESDIRRLCIRRDHIMPNWPVHHVRYFLAKNSESSGSRTGRWPEGWQV